MPPNPDDHQRQRQKTKKTADGCNVGNSIIPLAFCAAGLALTLTDKYRGDRQLFIAGFSLGIAITSLEFLIGFLFCLCGVVSFICCKDRDPETVVKHQAFFNAIFVLGNIASFGVLVAALVSSQDIANNDKYGCANGFGCANIMAIIACIFFGFYALVMALTTCCICCAACCACCMFATAMSTASRTAQDMEEGATAHPTEMPMAVQPPEEPSEQNA